MALAIPLIVMVMALMSAWILGVVFSNRRAGEQKFAGAVGLAVLFLAPLGYDASVFDGTCYGLDGTSRPCELRERIDQTFREGFAYLVVPAIMWVLIYTMALNSSKTK